MGGLRECHLREPLGAFGAFGGGGVRLVLQRSEPAVVLAQLVLPRLQLSGGELQPLVCDRRLWEVAEGGGGREAPPPLKVFEGRAKA